jgi:serine/threonine protein kinase
MPKYQVARNRRRQGCEEQARVLQPEYDGGDNPGTSKFSFSSPPNESHSPFPQLNNEADPNDEHHILRLRASFIHKNHLCLVFELLSSNLYELIKQNQFQGLSIQLVKVFTSQLLDALTVLKEARLIHCDLKPENILLKS